MDPATQPAPEQNNQNNQEHRKVGPIIATLTIVLILIIAALYVFASKVSQHVQSDPTIDDSSNVQQTQTIQAVQPVTNTSDDLQSIQNDLNTSTNGVDQQNF